MSQVPENRDNCIRLSVEIAFHLLFKSLTYNSDNVGQIFERAELFKLADELDGVTRKWSTESNG